jgi:hypothetical protein
MSLPPPAPRSGQSPARIAGLVALGCVVLCGVVGSCLLVLNLVAAPFVTQ